MLGHITSHLLEVRYFVQSNLNVLEVLDVQIIRLFFGALLCELLYIGGQLTEIGKHILPEEVVVLARQGKLLILLPIPHLDIDPIILDPKQLMKHSLIRPLVEERSGWVLFSINQKKQGPVVLDEILWMILLFFGELSLHFLGNQLTHLRVPLVSNHRKFPQGKEDREETFRDSQEFESLFMVPETWEFGEVHYGDHVQSNQIIFKGIVVHVDLLDLLHQIVCICLRQFF